MSSYIPLAPQSQEGIIGLEHVMKPKPIFDDPNYKACRKLKEKVTIIMGGDSGLGRVCAVAFAKEGATIVILYFNENKDAGKRNKSLNLIKVNVCYYQVI